MKTINKQLFFKNYPFSITEEKKVIIDELITRFDYSIKLTRISWFAYILATMKLETNDTFLPVPEGYYLPESRRISALKAYYKKNNKKAYKTIFPLGELMYYGRGYVQLTHNYNYKKFNSLIPNVDIFNNPDMVMNKDIAWIVLEEGMTRDDVTVKDINFTGHTLEMYLNDKKLDWVGARKIINGTNECNLIASYAQKYYKILEFNEEKKLLTPNINYADENRAEAEGMNITIISVDGVARRAIKSDV